MDTLCFKTFNNPSPEFSFVFWIQISIIYLAYLNQQDSESAAKCASVQQQLQEIKKK